MSDTTCTRSIPQQDVRLHTVCGHAAAAHGLVIGEAGDFRACFECWCPDYLPTEGVDYYTDADKRAVRLEGDAVVLDADTKDASEDALTTWTFDQGPITVEASGGALHVRYAAPMMQPPPDGMQFDYTTDPAMADLIEKAHDPRYSDEWIGMVFRSRLMK